jgi:5'(3')-deoxyribonucleotidase
VKSFELESTHESRPVIYLDMDGVLADMFGEVAKREGAPHWRKARKLKDRIDQVAKDPGFFEELPPLPNAGKLVRGVIKLAGYFSILSSPLMSRVEQSSEEKSQWIDRYMSKYPIESVIFDHHKEKFARQADGTPNILIDDFDSNIKLWEANGGIGILYEDVRVDQALRKLSYALDGLIPVEEPVDDEDAIRTDVTDKTKLYTDKQVLKYVKGIHHEYHLEKPITKHKVWVLRNVPLVDLQTPEFYDQDDPYRRVIDLDWDHISTITADDIKRRPVVADENGWLLDGNHRFTAARAKGLDTIPALIPYIPE